MQRRIYVLMIVGLVMAGCAESPKPEPEPQTVQTASVFGAATTDTQRYFYGMGEGKSITEARNAALADIASRITVSVGASMQQVTEYRRREDEERLNRELRTDIRADTRQIDFVGVKDIATEKIDGRWHVSVSVDRALLANRYEEKTAQSFRDVESGYSLYQDDTLFMQLKRAGALKTQLRSFEGDLALLEAIRPGYDSSAYRTKIEAMDKSFAGLPGKVRFQIRSDANSQALVPLLKDALMQEGYGVAASGGNLVLVVQTGYEQKHYKSANEKMANMIFIERKTQFKVLNQDGTLAAEHLVTTRAASARSVQDALKQTAPYRRLIDEAGIIAFIGGTL